MLASYAPAEVRLKVEPAASSGRVAPGTSCGESFGAAPQSEAGSRAAAFVDGTGHIAADQATRAGRPGQDGLPAVEAGKGEVDSFRSVLHDVWASKTSCDGAEGGFGWQAGSRTAVRGDPSGAALGPKAVADADGEREPNGRSAGPPAAVPVLWEALLALEGWLPVAPAGGPGQATLLGRDTIGLEGLQDLVGPRPGLRDVVRGAPPGSLWYAAATPSGQATLSLVAYGEPVPAALAGGGPAEPGDPVEPPVEAKPGWREAPQARGTPASVPASAANAAAGYLERPLPPSISPAAPTQGSSAGASPGGAGVLGGPARAGSGSAREQLQGPAGTGAKWHEQAPGTSVPPATAGSEPERILSGSPDSGPPYKASEPAGNRPAGVANPAGHPPPGGFDDETGPALAKPRGGPGLAGQAGMAAELSAPAARAAGQRGYVEAVGQAFGKPTASSLYADGPIAMGSVAGERLSPVKQAPGQASGSAPPSFPEEAVVATGADAAYPASPGEPAWTWEPGPNPGRWPAGRLANVEGPNQGPGPASFQEFGQQEEARIQQSGPRERFSPQFAREPVAPGGPPGTKPLSVDARPAPPDTVPGSPFAPEGGAFLPAGRQTEGPVAPVLGPTAATATGPGSSTTPWPAGGEGAGDGGSAREPVGLAADTPGVEAAATGAPRTPVSPASAGPVESALRSTGSSAALPEGFQGPVDERAQTAYPEAIPLSQDADLGLYEPGRHAGRMSSGLPWGGLRHDKPAPAPAGGPAGALPSQAASGSAQSADATDGARFSGEPTAVAYVRPEKVETDGLPSGHPARSDGGALEPPTSGREAPPGERMALGRGALAHDPMAADVQTGSLLAQDRSPIDMGHRLAQAAQRWLQTSAPEIPGLRVAHARFDAQAGEFHLKLHPPELGTLRVRVSGREGSLAVAITADRPETGWLLSRHGPALEHAFEQAGLRLSNFSVDVGTGNPFGGHPQPRGEPVLAPAAWQAPRDLPDRSAEGAGGEMGGWVAPASWERRAVDLRV